MIVDIDILIENELSISQYLLACFVVDNNQDGFLEYSQKCGQFKESEMKSLIEKDFLFFTGQTIYNFHELFPTEKLTELIAQMNASIPPPAKQVEEITDFDSLCEKYRALFPDKLKNGAGQLFRSSLNNVKTKMKTFVKKHKYSEEVILQATKQYVERYRLKQYTYMRTAIYFIEKDRVSDLATECDDVLTKNDVQQPAVKRYGSKLS